MGVNHRGNVGCPYIMTAPPPIDCTLDLKIAVFLKRKCLSLSIDEERGGAVAKVQLSTTGARRCCPEIGTPAMYLNLAK